MAPNNREIAIGGEDLVGDNQGGANVGVGEWDVVAANMRARERLLMESSDDDNSDGEGMEWIDDDDGNDGDNEQEEDEGVVEQRGNEDMEPDVMDGLHDVMVTLYGIQTHVQWAWPSEWEDEGVDRWDIQRLIIAQLAIYVGNWERSHEGAIVTMRGVRARLLICNRFLYWWFRRTNEYGRIPDETYSTSPVLEERLRAYAHDDGFQEDFSDSESDLL